MPETAAAELLASNRECDDKMHRIAFEMHETAIATRELIEIARQRIRQADELLRRGKALN
jgi:hypothetical protein